MTPTPRDGLPLEAGTPAASFTELLRSRGIGPSWDMTRAAGDALEPPEGTTVLALRYAHGVVMAGDRRAVTGNIIAHRNVQKVYPADAFSAVAISGTAGVAIELVKLFQTELEHYEKIEGRRLSLAGKANHLAAMVRRQLPMAFQGLVVIPLFCGFDGVAGEGRLYSYDVVGGSYEETDYATTGSGGRDARLYIRTQYSPDMNEDAAVDLAVAALVAAAEEDTATGGPDLKREIYPNVVTVSSMGFREIDDDRIAVAARTAMGGDA
ncbi:MAG TPA: proteasome subunit beta [Acidimicrobiia bacterium]|nr:proteasome subunit beta [Acidimicrobiia bacterium]